MKISFIIYFLCSVRIAAMFMSSPIFSLTQIPSLVKVGMSLMISFLIYGTLNINSSIIPQTLIQLVLASGKEIIVGASIGFTATLIFNAVRVAAQLMDFSIGFSMAQYYDPTTSGNSTPIERLFNWIAIMIFITFNFHHIIIAAAIKSFSVIPLGLNSIAINSFSVLMNTFSSGFYLAMQLAAPIIIILFLTDFTLGLIARTVPQLNVFLISLPIKILVGLLALAAVLPGLIHMFIKVFENMQGSLIKYFNVFPFIILMANDERTEEPSEKKISDAKKKGQVAKSIDLNSAIVLLGITLVFSMLGSYFYENGRSFIIESFNLINKNEITSKGLNSIFIFALKNGLSISAPVILTAMLLGIIGNIAQTGMIFTSESLKPKFEKLNPVEGFKRFFNKRTLVELIKSILKVSVIAYVSYSFIKGKLFDILKTSDLNTRGLLPFVSSLINSQLIRLVIILFVIGVADFIFQKRQLKKELRMTKQEVKEEYKEMEGDPLIKSRIRQKQKELAMRRMMQNVPKATVVVTNPTHYAVALKYERGKDEAPVVLAKGCDYVALKIKEIANKNHVPIIENRPLARALYAKADIDRYVPVELYQAVAEIIAYVYSLKKH